jgi:diguanylate cyclase (GGDEF)-like protein
MTSDKQGQALARQISRLRSGYIARLPDELRVLHDLAVQLKGDERDRQPLTELHHGLHRITGTAGTFGCNALSAATRNLEQQLKNWLAADLSSIDAESRLLFTDELAALAGFVPSAAQPTDFVPDKTSAPPRAETALVWLVESDDETRNRLAQLLDSFNYAVQSFEDLEEADRAARAAQPDLLIMELNPEQAGAQETQTLPRYPALARLESPVLFTSTRDDFNSRVQAARLGAAALFIKPVDGHRLVSQLSQIQEQRRAPPKRVLIVEDDPDLAEHMRLILLSAGMQTEVLSHPRDIIKVLARFRPELVLMDVYMPDYSGPDLAGVIRQYEDYTHLPIVYLSAEVDMEQQILAMKRGADDFLTKPISDIQLVATANARIARARELERQITKDSLTGLLKHASIKQAAEHEARRARRTGRPVTMAMLDIDHFKTVNDSHGHACGDQVIVALATLLRQRLRHSDIVGRYGGEEFVALLPECHADNAFLLLDEIRERFASLRFNHDGQEFHCTLSAGFACSQAAPLDDGAALLIAADEALYVAKRNGRNQVRLSQRAGDA